MRPSESPHEDDPLRVQYYSRRFLYRHGEARVDPPDDVAGAGGVLGAEGVDEARLHVAGLRRFLALADTVGGAFGRDHGAVRAGLLLDAAVRLGLHGVQVRRECRADLAARRMERGLGERE